MFNQLVNIQRNASSSVNAFVQFHHRNAHIAVVVPHVSKTDGNTWNGSMEAVISGKGKVFEKLPPSAMSFVLQCTGISVNRT